MTVSYTHLYDGIPCVLVSSDLEGIKEAGKEADAVFVSDMNIDELKGEGVFALGCPAMGAEVLEELSLIHI